MEHEFEPFPKMPRVSREVIITEKIDGTNAQVFISEDGDILAGSRKQWITPAADNFGFAVWVEKNAAKKATEEFEGTIGDLRTMIKTRERDGSMSIVNPAFPLDRVLDIYTAALGDRDDAEKVVIWKPDPYSTKGYMKRTRDAMIVKNILRDCA